MVDVLLTNVGRSKPQNHLDINYKKCRNVKVTKVVEIFSPVMEPTLVKKKK